MVPRLSRVLLVLVVTSACTHRSASTLTVGGIEGVEDAATRFRDVAIVDGPGPTTIGLTVDGAIRVFGDVSGDPRVERNPNFPGYYTAMGVTPWGESAIICGVTHGGSVDCGVLPSAGWSEPPVLESVGDTPYTAIRGNCGLRTDGHVECFVPPSLADVANLDAPEGLFRSLDVTADLGCALREDGEVLCWGGVAPDLIEADGLVGVRLFGDFPMGLTAHGQAVPLAGVAQMPAALRRLPEGRYWDILLAGSHGCALEVDGTVVCFGRPPVDAGGRALRAVLRPPDIGFHALAVGRTHACGVQVDGQLQCWGACSGHPAGCSAGGEER